MSDENLNVEIDIDSILSEFDLESPDAEQFKSEPKNNAVRIQQSGGNVPATVLTDAIKTGVEKYGATIGAFVHATNVLRKQYTRPEVVKALTSKLSISQNVSEGMDKEQIAEQKNKMAAKIHSMAEQSMKRRLISEVMGVPADLMEKHDPDTNTGTKDQIVTAVYKGVRKIQGKRKDTDILYEINFPAHAATVDGNTVSYPCYRDAHKELFDARTAIGHRKAPGEEATAELESKRDELEKALKERGASDEKCAEFVAGFNAKYFATEEMLQRVTDAHQNLEAIRAEYLRRVETLKSRLTEQWKAGQRGRSSSVNTDIFSFGDTVEV